MKRFQRILAAILTLCLLAGMLPVLTFAVTMGTKPENGSNTGEPFPEYTAGSHSFRIPALVTLSDGTLVAAADARWNTTYDGGGLDTIVAWSSDNGAKWDYTFANYLGDNGNTYNATGSTAFIDPALAVTGDDTIYMLVDLYPYGVALNGNGQQAPVATTGFIDDNKLKLSNNSHSSYDYYLNLTDYKIYTVNGNTQVTGYTVDKHFNITDSNGTTSNLFFSDSPFRVVRTGFLYLTKSTDKGASWSAPQLLNLKTTSELVCLVGPGRGLVTKDGMIVFPVYSFHGDNDPSDNTQRMSFIYSSDGVNWKRSAELDYNWASESAPVELNNGKLRFFLRNGTTNLSYVDYDRTAGTWGTPVTLSDVHTNSNCQISAMTYSGTIDGKQVILVSCPTGPNSAGSNQSGASYRLNGKIFAFTVNEDGTMTREGTIAVNNGQFMYSCLTELKNGSVGLLYEDSENNWGYGTNSYYTMSYATYDLTKDMALTFDAPPAPGIYNANLELTDEEKLYMGAGKDLSFVGLEDGQTLTAAGYDKGIVNVTVSGSTIQLDPVSTGETTITFTVTANTRAVGDTYNLKVTVLEDLTLSVYDGTALAEKQNLTVGQNKTLTHSPLEAGQTLTASGYDTNMVEVSIANGDITLIAKSSGHTTVTFTLTGANGETATYQVLVGITATIEGNDSITQTGAAATYVLDTNGVDDNAKYLIVYRTNATATSGQALNTSKGSTAVTINGNYATPVSDAASAVWEYTKGNGNSRYFVNGENYLYTSSTINWQTGYVYSLNVSGTRTPVTVTDDGNGMYRIHRNNYGVNTYISYNNGWHASNTGTSLYLYKYTEGTLKYEVDPQLQEARTDALTIADDGYSTSTWQAYQAALTAAQTNLTTVKGATYDTQDEAEAALNGLIDKVNALEAAYKALVKPVKADTTPQANRINSLTITTNDGYTDESWAAYEQALADANDKLNEVTDAEYNSNAEAEAALAELTAAVDALEAAKNALVRSVTITIAYQVTGTTVVTATAEVTDKDTGYDLPGIVSDGNGQYYSVAYSTLTLQNGVTSYHVPVTPLAGTPLSIKENELANVEVTLEDGQYVQWSTGDGAYVGVAGKYDNVAGKFTNEAVIQGQKVTNEPILVTGTVYHADGTVASVNRWLVTVTQGDADTNTSRKHIYVNLKTLINCTAYYSINGGPLIPVNGTGVMIDADITGKFNFMAFGVPNEGYALSYMSVSGSGNQYYTLTDGNPDGTGSNAWPFADPNQATIPATSGDAAWVSGHGLRWPLLEGNMSIEQLKVLFSNAISLGASGIVSFTKNANESYYTELQFVAQKIATMEKEIVDVTRANGQQVDYTEGMEIQIGDTIRYKITITDPAIPTGEILDVNGTYTASSPITTYNKPSYTQGNYGKIVYTDVKLTDELTGSKFVDSNGNTVTLNMTESKETETVYELYTSIQLNTSNFLRLVKNGKITNEAVLVYNYSSQYTSGKLDTKADAVAEVLVELPEYVIDFGLPVTIDLTYDPLVESDKIMEATANYGIAQIVGERTLVYIPTQVLQEPDFITLTFADDGNENAIIGYGVRVYPATTIYYEEGFAQYAGGWTGTTSVTGTTYTKMQETAEVGEVQGYVENGQTVYAFHYGYDDVYAAEAAGPSNGTQAVSAAKGNTATFTFTGTGVEVYANCAPSTGLINVLIRNAAGKAVKFYQVDTVTGGKSPVTTPQEQIENAYSLPVVSVLGLAHDTYTVTISHAIRNLGDAAGEVRIDGFRVYGTVDTSAVAYVRDGEAGPFFINLRDELLTVIQAPDKCTSMYEAASSIVDQVFANSGNLEGAVYLGVASAGWSEDALKDLLDNGPKNEIYLYAKDDTLVFTIPTGVNNVQLGLKTVTGATSYSITVNGTQVDAKTLTTSTDMFYTLTLTPNTANVVTVTNTGSQILSITKLKCLSDVAATSLGEISTEHMMLALTAMGVQEEAPVPVNPFTDVKSDRFEAAILWAYYGGITTGTGDGSTFSPENVCTRKQIVTFLWRAAGEPEPRSMVNPFTDVKSDRFEKAILWAYYEGITSGTGDGSTFSPEATCTRKQIVTFLWRYKGQPQPQSMENKFVDVKNDRFTAAILWAAEQGITTGTGDGTTFSPENPCTRKQIVTFLYRATAQQ